MSTQEAGLSGIVDITKGEESMMKTKGKLKGGKLLVATLHR